MGEDSGFDAVDHRLEGLPDVGQDGGGDGVPDAFEATPRRDEPVLGPHRRVGRSVEEAGRLAVDGQLQHLSLGVGVVLAQSPVGVGLSRLVVEDVQRAVVCHVDAVGVPVEADGRPSGDRGRRCPTRRGEAELQLGGQRPRAVALAVERIGVEEPQQVAMIRLLSWCQKIGRPVRPRRS